MVALAPGARVVSLGGATEASIWSITHPIERVDPGWSSIPYGTPLANQSFAVLDRQMCPRPVWATGDLYIGGLGLAAGYWRDPDKTARSFVHHPVTGERLYRTGDLGRYLPDGTIEFLGREDSQVKVQGFRIELGEIEAALRRHPAISDAVATVQGERMGHKRLVAYIVSRWAVDWRRGELRVPVAGRADIELEGVPRVGAAVVDLSADGVGLGELAAPLPVGARVRLRCALAGAALDLMATVEWSAGARAGVHVEPGLDHAALVDTVSDLALERADFLMDLRTTRVRIPAKGRCHVDVGDSRTWPASLCDLSVDGCGVADLPDQAPGTPVMLTLPLPPDGELIEVRGRVRWCHGGRTGVQFDDDQIRVRSMITQFLTLAMEQGQYIQGDLRSFLEHKLPDYMIPSAFVLLNRLPLTQNGKVDRAALPSLQQSRQKLRRQLGSRQPGSEREQALVEMWRQLLQVDDIGPDDNFFDLGGDSILALQVVARAGDLGLRIRPQQLYDDPTISGLLRAAEDMPDDGGAAAAASGPAPLLPGQEWFFEQGLLNPHLWYDGHLLESAAPLDPDRMRQALRILLSHHDALRSRYVRVASSWSQRIVESEPGVSLDLHDASALDPAGQAALIDRIAARLQSTLDLAAGPLVRTAIIDRGPDLPNVVIIVGHHLVLDGFSWRLLLEDLQQVYLELGTGGEVQLPGKSAPLRTWAEAVARYADSPELAGELAFWQRIAGRATAGLPMDRPGLPNVESLVSAYARFDPEFTRFLVLELRARMGASLHAAILTAFADTLSSWTGAGVAPFDMLAHGREGLPEPIDASRTVGRLLTVHPVFLELPPGGDSLAQLAAVRAQYDEIRRHGFAYGPLRYLRSIDDSSTRLRQLPRPEIVLNYVGHFDYVLKSASPFSRLTLLRRSEEANMTGTRHYALEVTMAVMEGCFQMEWRYSRNVLDDATIQRQVDSFEAPCTGWPTRCARPGASGRPGRGARDERRPRPGPEAATVRGYQLGAELGRGAASVVYLAQRDGRSYAVKLLANGGAHDEEAIRRFRREAAAAARLDHAGLAKIEEVGETEVGQSYLVMEFINGRSLADRLTDGPLSEAELVDLAGQLAQVLHEIHGRGLVHRDLKPANILLEPSGAVRVLDLGLAAYAWEAPDPGGPIVGTFRYSAPEQSGVLSRAVNGRSDLYALGAMLYECATGEPPFEADSLDELLRMHLTVTPPDVHQQNPAIRPIVSRIIATLLAKDPDDRYQSADALAADLRALPELDARERRGETVELGRRGSLVPLRYEVALVGRKAEVASLRGAWQRARAGAGR